MKLRELLRPPIRQWSRNLARDVTVQTANAIGDVLDTDAEIRELRGTPGDLVAAEAFREAANRARTTGTEIAEHVKNGEAL